MISDRKTWRQQTIDEELDIGSCSCSCMFAVSCLVTCGDREVRQLAAATVRNKAKRDAINASGINSETHKAC
jgi:hypothetical protein